jgi:hypothetical protein
VSLRISGRSDGFEKVAQVCVGFGEGLCANAYER